MFVLGSGERGAIKLRGFALRQVAEIMNYLARRFDRRLTDRDAPLGRTANARRKASLADYADDRDRMKVLRHDLTGEEIDPGHLDVGDRLGRSDLQAADWNSRGDLRGRS